MKALADRFLGEIEAPDGLILKYPSLSCGPREAKMYVNEKRGAASTTDKRDVRWSVAKSFPHRAIEVEGRLKSFDIGQHLLTRLSALGRFRHVSACGRMRDLVTFHSRAQACANGVQSNEDARAWMHRLQSKQETDLHGSFGLRASSILHGSKPPAVRR